jgi:hypothetical protein
MKYFILVLWIALCGPVFAEEIHLAKTYPFQVGERSVFRVTVFGFEVASIDYRIDDYTSYQGRTVVISTMKIDTTEFFSSWYKIHNKETSFTLPNDFTSLYCEKYIDEAEMFDLIKCTFPTNQDPTNYSANCVSKVSNVKSFTITTNGVMRNFPDLICLIRALDYDYYVKTKKNIEITFFDGLLRINHFTFRAVNRKMTYQDKEIDTICVEESSGNGMAYYMKNDVSKAPVLMVVPTFSILGIGKISIYGDLKEYRAGTGVIK